MERRNFILNGLGAMASIPIAAGPYKSLLTWHSFFREDFPVCGINPQDIRLSLKPIMTNMIHSGVWEGPCRNNVVTVEEETKRVNESFNSWSNNLVNQKSRFDPGNVILMEPSLVIFNEDFTIYPDQFEKTEPDAIKADAFLISPDGASIATFKIAEKYKKPIISDWGLNCRTVDIAAYTRSHGLEMFVPNSQEEMLRVISCLRARKILSGTRILYPTEWGWPSVASITGINEPERLKDRFGVDLVTISYERLGAMMENMIKNPEVQNKAEKLAQTLIDNADHSYLDEKFVIKSLIFYESIIKLMKEYQCNSFTIECFEFCSSQLPEKWEVTPCLVHTLFKDQGIPSACEGDFAALLGMELLMSLSGKSPHLGNMFMEKNESLQINHSVPGIRMNGFNEPPLPYQLGRFVESGWGTKVSVDFMNNDEKNVTVIRMNPDASSLLVLKGRLVGSSGYDEDLLSCSASAYVVGQASGTAREFIEKQVNYGNHLVWVYGDYSKELKQMTEMLKMDIEIIS
jgi:L-fucose isomerase-like protein